MTADTNLLHELRTSVPCDASDAAALLDRAAARIEALEGKLDGALLGAAILRDDKERLRALVESAYREGWRTGYHSSHGGGGHGESATDYDRSAARRALDAKGGG